MRGGGSKVYTLWEKPTDVGLDLRFPNSKYAPRRMPAALSEVQWQWSNYELTRPSIESRIFDLWCEPSLPGGRWWPRPMKGTHVSSFFTPIF